MDDALKALQKYHRSCVVRGPSAGREANSWVALDTYERLWDFVPFIFLMAFGTFLLYPSRQRQVGVLHFLGQLVLLVNF